jgi:hypothetical protein
MLQELFQYKVWFLKNLLSFNGHKIETLSLVDVEAFLTTAEYKTTPNKKSRLKMRQGKKNVSSYTNNANFAEDNFEEYAEIVENSETDNLALSDHDHLTLACYGRDK